MGFAKPGGGDPDELRFGAELFDVGAPDVSHSAAEAAHHLEQHVAHRTLVWNTPLDSLWYQLLGGHLAFLKIPIGASILHRGETAHAANHLETAALEEERFTRTFFGSGEHRSHHHAGCARRQRFHDVARVLDPTIGDHRNVTRTLDCIEDRGELGNADAGNDARGANGARTDTNFHRVHATLDQRPCARTRSD